MKKYISQSLIALIFLFIGAGAYYIVDELVSRHDSDDVIVNINHKNDDLRDVDLNRTDTESDPEINKGQTGKDNNENIDVNTNSEVPSKYKYKVDVEAYMYEPDNSYVGLRTCDLKNSTCTIYGVKASDVAKAVLGQKFTVEFNEMGEATAAAGTTYIPIIGEFQLTPR